MTWRHNLIVSEKLFGNNYTRAFVSAQPNNYTFVETMDAKLNYGLSTPKNIIVSEELLGRKLNFETMEVP